MTAQERYEEIVASIEEGCQCGHHGLSAYGGWAQRSAQYALNAVGASATGEEYDVAYDWATDETDYDGDPWGAFRDALQNGASVADAHKAALAAR